MVNVTFPLGVPFPDVGATVAVNVTESPMFDGFFDETSVVVVAGNPTAWLNAFDTVLLPKVESPP
jgi:hypothetical protein